MTINIHQARAHFSRLVQRAADGEEIVIARAGKPVARLVPIKARRQPRVFGKDRKTLAISHNFDKPLPASVFQDLER